MEIKNFVTIRIYNPSKIVEYIDSTIVLDENIPFEEIPDHISSVMQLIFPSIEKHEIISTYEMECKMTGKASIKF